MSSKDINFAYKVRHALNERIDDMPTATLDRLAAARQMALSRKKADKPLRVVAHQNVVAGTANSFFPQATSWWTRLGVAAPILTGVVLFFGLYQYEQQHRITEIAAIDAAVLADEVPPSAYLDRGFDTYLAKHEE
ncbi:DUF3619 family protein [Glaciimonas sp. CA11.2]|uniref:DUF3619 family protein n=1 Tax=unclassified Glaciimonas TaxID=2644401 RepID=UPI002AB49155|nr:MULTISPECIES: DUF3619 family protein [unclassified Glaciimonas]MDY7547576.1 DUF3619 family protein [Glaciimonas sp. CA11.2]MEB0014239.1 DUF3619 family protein [Glaciimonas sp. Cout2]MEB0084025.1 DUF3619 family protein [Glaciimonas sp. Gout2]MEB0163523.1 DUF3619 family protein [Glaciimonas sp. CA11.2]